MHPSNARLKWHCRPGVERPLRYAKRLLGMGPREIAARIGHRAFPDRPVSAPPWQPPDRRLLADWLESRFLFGPAGGRRIAEEWRKEHPDAAARLVEKARQGLDRWEIFGVAVALEPGTIDWQTGDLRWVWELNRHQYLFTFARAWVLTGDGAYARRIAGLLADWWNDNRAGRGVNWSSGLEVGVRAISWLWTLALLTDWAELDDEFLGAWLASLVQHYQYLRDHLSIYLDPTNHLIGEAAALWLLSVTLPNLPDAEGQERRAMDILRREIARQVTADGVSREQSTGYQRFVLDFCLQVIAVARRAERSLPAIVEERAAAMLGFLAVLACEDGEIPAIGDSDDARGVPLAELSGRDFGDLLGCTPDLSVWVAIPPAPAAGGSRTFPEGGYCYWETEKAGLLFDAGPLGLWPNASHGHADALSIQVKVNGRWLLGDPGTGCYSAAGGIRDQLRGTAAHNTVTVDGMDQTDVLGVFRWLKPVPTRMLEMHAEPKCEVAVAVHEGYHRLRQPVTHYRAVLFLRPPSLWSGCVIVDRLEGAGIHHCALRFHFAPDVELRFEDPQTVEAAGLRLLFSEPGARVESGLWSRRYGQWEQAPVVVLERTAELPLAWFTFLEPGGSAARGDRVETAREGALVLCKRRWGVEEEKIEWLLERGRSRVRYESSTRSS